MLDRVKALGSHLRRRIYTEEKAKVVAAVWGSELIQLLAAQAILHQYDLKNRMNSYFSSFHPDAIYPFLYIIRVQLILFFISSWCKIASAERNLINSAPQTAARNFAFSSVFILRLCVQYIQYVQCTYI